jgi:3-hydroxyisobutyrate dehydrogenase
MTNHTWQIGFVGLGAMGQGMAQSLVKAGLAVRGYDLNPAAVEKFTAAGGQGVDSITAAAGGADILVIVVVSAEQAEQVLFGPGGAVEVLPQGSVVMLCSTVKPDSARTLAARLYALGLEMLDSPISGGTAKASQGQLSVMASGHPAALAKCQPVLAAVAERVFNLGETCGLGSTVKMVNQLLAGVHIAAAAEAMAFGVKAGVAPEKIYEVISNSAGSSWMFQNRVPHMLAGDYTPLSAVEIFVKDLDIVLDTGKAERFPLPLAAIAHQMFLMAAAAGHGMEDDSAVVKVFEQLANIKVTR